MAVWKKIILLSKCRVKVGYHLCSVFSALHFEADTLLYFCFLVFFRNRTTHKKPEQGRQGKLRAAISFCIGIRERVQAEEFKQTCSAYRFLEKLEVVIISTARSSVDFPSGIWTTGTYYYFNQFLLLSKFNWPCLVVVSILFSLDMNLRDAICHASLLSVS